ncbi:MAG: serpin family protein, partial [Candidatus Korarchaeota archaeon]|nr:serpin family protein [Candidatus Korarchaeota archaeon]
AAELQHTFGFEQDPDERRSGFSQMLNSYGKQNNERWKEKPYELKIANALWLAHEFEPKRQYVDTAVSYYNSTVESVDFVTDDGVNKINDWVKE